MAAIRRATDADRAAIWRIIKAVIAGGDTYVFDPATPEDELMAYWFSPEKHVYVAEDNGEVLGTYWLKANQPGFGDHVGNGAYMVSPEAKEKASAGRWLFILSRKPDESAFTRSNSISSSNLIRLQSTSGKASALRSSVRYRTPFDTQKTALRTR